MISVSGDDFISYFLQNISVVVCQFVISYYKLEPNIVIIQIHVRSNL